MSVERAGGLSVEVEDVFRSDGSIETDCVAVEEPLEIRVDTHPIAITMRTPGHDEELAAGFLVSEGAIDSPDQIQRLSQNPVNGFGNSVDVFLRDGDPELVRRLSRHVFGSSSCGVCGKATIVSIRRQFSPIESELRIAKAVIAGLPESMVKHQSAFAATGGLHAAALFDAEGKFEILREDVGRHNAIDKVVGWAFLERRLPLRECVLVVSGRVSFEIVQKAMAASIPVIAAVSAPTSLAVELARECGLTLAGFVREGRMNVYSKPERIEF